MSATAFQRMRREQAAREAAKEKKSVEDPELEALRERGKDLGVKNWHNMGKEKLIEKIAEVEAHDVKLGAAIDKAVELGVEGYGELDLDTLLTAIEAKESEDKGGEGNGVNTD